MPAWNFPITRKGFSERESWDYTQKLCHYYDAIVVLAELEELCAKGLNDTWFGLYHNERGVVAVVIFLLAEGMQILLSVMQIEHREVFSQFLLIVRASLLLFNIATHYFPYNRSNTIAGGRLQEERHILPKDIKRYCSRVCGNIGQGQEEFVNYLKDHPLLKELLKRERLDMQRTSLGLNDLLKGDDGGRLDLEDINVLELQLALRVCILLSLAESMTLVNRLRRLMTGGTQNEQSDDKDMRFLVTVKFTVLVRLDGISKRLFVPILTPVFVTDNITTDGRKRVMFNPQYASTLFYDKEKVRAQNVLQYFACMQSRETFSIFKQLPRELLELIFQYLLDWGDETFFKHTILKEVEGRVLNIRDNRASSLKLAGPL